MNRDIYFGNNASESVFNIFVRVPFIKMRYTLVLILLKSYSIFFLRVPFLKMTVH